MNRILAVTVMALTLSLALAPISVSASGWDENPLSRLDKQTGVNSSYHPDWNKQQNISVKAYGWQFSKVCGLDLCAGEINDGAKSKSFIKSEQVKSPQTLSPRFGMSATGDDFSLINQSMFDGHYYIKGFFR